MKKKYLLILLTLLLALGLTACGNGGSSGNSGGDRFATDYYAPTGDASNESSDSGWTDSAEPDAPEQIRSTLPANTKVILSADIDLETTEFDTAEQAINQLVTDTGGWFEGRSIYQGGSYRSLQATIRVPAQSFNAFLEQAGQTAHVTSRDEYAEDISEAYYDNESRLATQRTKLERLQTLLAQASVMEDIISLESAISETELEIEHLTGSLRKYDSLVGYSTITLRLQEVYRLSSDEEPAVTFGQRMASAFSLGLTRGVSGVEDFAVALARNWFNLLILVVLVCIAAILVRWWNRKRSRVYPQPPKPPKPPKPPEPPEPPVSKE